MIIMSQSINYNFSQEMNCREAKNFIFLQISHICNVINQEQRGKLIESQYDAWV